MASQRQAAGCPNVSDVKGGMNLGGHPRLAHGQSIGLPRRWGASGVDLGRQIEHGV
ncbi:MAG: hypothetical protein HHJ15_16915 [Rhodoferax sp.]|nr:hypothetical protein [Rhodoferax sp.]